MATSGSVNYTETRDNVIRDALILLGAVYEDETINDSTLNFCNRMLNKMIKAWNAQGLHLWTYDEGVIVFDNDTVSYSLYDDTGTDTVFLASGYVQTTFSADEAASQTILSVTSSTGMAASDVVLIELDSGSLHKTTIASVDSATQITVDDALASAAASGNFIYAYTASTDLLDGVKQVTNVRLRDSSGNDRTLTRLSREEYYNLNNKTSEGTPSSFYVDYERDDPVMYVWPEPSSLREHLRFTFNKSIEDMDAGSNNFDFPQEWLEAITYNLAVRIAPGFGKEAKLPVLVPLAEMFLNEVKAWDDEPAEVQMMPEIY